MSSPSSPDPLSEAADQLRLLVDGVQDHAIVLLDRDGNVTAWNGGAERIKGYTAEQIIGRHFSCFYTPEDVASGLPGHVLRMAERDGTYEEGGWRVRKDGTRFWADLVVTALVDDEGELRGFGKLVRDLTARREAELERDRLIAELTVAARTDELTGLINRRVWREGLEVELARAARYGTTVTLAVLDIDGFKAVNDAFGHLRGDNLLREASTRWSAALRPTDSLARFGGDEFVCTLPETTEEEAELALGRLRDVSPAGVSFSAGIAGWRAGETVDELFARADGALYRSKREGPGRTIRAS